MSVIWQQLRVHVELYIFLRAVPFRIFDNHVEREDKKSKRPIHFFKEYRNYTKFVGGTENIRESY